MPALIFFQTIAGCHCELCSSHPWESDCHKWCCSRHWSCPDTNWHLHPRLSRSRRWPFIIQSKKQGRFPWVVENLPFLARSAYCKKSAIQQIWPTATMYKNTYIPIPTSQRRYHPIHSDNKCLDLTIKEGWLCDYSMFGGFRTCPFRDCTCCWICYSQINTGRPPFLANSLRKTGKDLIWWAKEYQLNNLTRANVSGEAVNSLLTH